MISRVLNWFLVLTFSLSLVSCEGVKDGNGIVLDSTTNLPLEGVLVTSYLEEVQEEYQKEAQLPILLVSF